MTSVRVGSLFGIPIRLGASFLLVIPLLAYLVGSQLETTVEMLDQALGLTIDASALGTGATPWLLGLAAALGLFASVLAHELGHSLVARRYGLAVEAITLWFLGGLSQFAELPEDWRAEFTIAVVGPLVSVAVGLACYGAFLLVPDDLHAARFLLAYLAVLNVVLAAFNMLPGFPMDGGRVLRALLSRSRSRLRATEIAATVGKGFAVLLAAVGVLAGDLFAVLIAFFVFVAATAETRQVVADAAFEGLHVAELMTPAEELDTVEPDASLAALLDRMVVERHTGYPVVEDGRLVGLVTLEDVQRRDAEEHDAATVREVMSTDLVTVSEDAQATQALQTLQEEGIGRLLVTGPDGSLRGLLSRTDLLTVLEIQRAGRTARGAIPGRS